MFDGLQSLGRVTLNFFERLGRGNRFLVQALSQLPGVLLRPRLVLAQLYSVGVLTLLIILVSGLFVGMVLGLQGYNTLVDFGAEESLGALTLERKKYRAHNATQLLWLIIPWFYPLITVNLII